MADNVVLNAGAGGSTLATDDVVGVHYQRVKLVDGTLDSTAGIPGDAANGLDVDVTRVAGTVTTDPSDRALRDVGKIDVALLDQYTPQDVDTGAGVDNALPVVLRLPASGGGVNAPGDAANGVDVDVTRVQGTVAISAASLPLPTGAATEATLATRLTEADFDTKTGALLETAPATDTASSGLNGRLQRIAQRITSLIALLPAALVGGRLDVNVGNTPTVTLVPATSGGLTMTKLISAATTNATNAKASAGQVYAVQVFNINAAVRYLKLYNKATAPTVGTDIPVKTITIPGNTAGAGVVMVSWEQGLAFGTGIGFALTTGVADADTGAVAANEIVVNMDYK